MYLYETSIKKWCIPEAFRTKCNIWKWIDWEIRMIQEHIQSGQHFDRELLLSMAGNMHNFDWLIHQHGVTTINGHCIFKDRNKPKNQSVTLSYIYRYICFWMCDCTSQKKMVIPMQTTPAPNPHKMINSKIMSSGLFMQKLSNPTPIAQKNWCNLRCVWKT